MTTKLFTSESVSEGHPDKLCDQVSDAILDAVIAQDKKARVACETLVKSEEGSKGVVIIGGEITTSAKVDYENIVRETIKNIGYDSEELGFDSKTVEFINKLREEKKFDNIDLLKEQILQDISQAKEILE